MKIDIVSSFMESDFWWDKVTFRQAEKMANNQDCIEQISRLDIIAAPKGGFKAEMTYVDIELGYRDVYYYSLETQLHIDENGIIHNCHCSCDNFYRYSVCKHILMLMVYLEQNEFKLPYHYRDKNWQDSLEFMKSLSQKRYLRKVEGEFNETMEMFAEKALQKTYREQTEGAVHLTSELHEKKMVDMGCTVIPIRFKIGKEKLYIIKNIERKLLTPLVEGSFISYGKNLKLEMRENAFTKEGIENLAFIQKYKQFSDGDTLMVNETSIDDFFHLYSSEAGLENLEFQSVDFRLKLNFEKIDDQKYMLKMEEVYPEGTKVNFSSVAFSTDGFIYREIDSLAMVSPLMVTERRFYLFDKNNKKLLYMDAGEMETLLYRTVKMKQMIFTREKLSEFISIFRGKTENIAIDDELLALVEESEFYRPELYCDMDEDSSFKIRVKYRGRRSSFFFISLVKWLETANVSELERLSQRSDKECRAGLDETFIISKDKEVETFIEEVLPELKNYADIYLSESIKNFNVKRSVGFSAGVKVKSNLLAVSMESELLTPGELHDILDGYRKKKKYFRLKSGEIIMPDPEELQEIDDFVTDLGIEGKELKKGKARVPLYRRYQISGEKRLDIDTDKHFEKLFEEEEIQVAKRFDTILRDYQKEGCRFMLNLRNGDFGGLLADDMGLGKTLQVIAMLESIEEEREKPCLIVTPASLILNWESEFKKFKSPLKVRCIYGNKNERKEMISSIGNEIIVTSYDYLKRDIEGYENLEFDTVILDEAQYIKNFNTKAARSVKVINREHSIALTGTPIENSLAEIWSIFDFLMPGYLFRYSYFMKNYEKPVVAEGDMQKSDRLKRMVEPFILRRLKKDVLKELPEKMETTRYITLSEEEKKLYTANLSQVNLALQGSDGKDKIKILSMLTRLRQLCIDPGLVYDDLQEKGDRKSVV